MVEQNKKDQLRLPFNSKKKTNLDLTPNLLFQTSVRAANCSVETWEFRPFLAISAV
jgi:hypothetical protein